MFIEFSVTNYRSILERQTLSMVASSYCKDLEAQNTIVSELSAGGTSLPRLLRSSALYGPNASGKSTLIAALKFVKEQVLNSHKDSQSGDAIEVQPFKLTAASRAAASTFEITFVEQGVRYEYGFCCSRERFTEEWLFAYPQGRAQKWFHRVFDVETGKDKYKFSSSFLGGRLRQSWVAQTRQNALFFSKAIQDNNAQLKPAFDWFRERLRVINSIREFVSNSVYTIEHCDNNEGRKRVLEFMNAADLSITDIQIEKSVFFAHSFDARLPGFVKTEAKKQFAGKNLVRLRFFHKDINTEELVEFDESEESDGTHALFAFAGLWLDVIEKGLILVVDELDTSLHPLLIESLVKRLHHAGTQAQLIFTTHDTSLLSQKLLRRDQVWFIEKDAQNASQLYPLSDFSPRQNEALERAYLNGRYGGIPFLKDLDFNGV